MKHPITRAERRSVRGLYIAKRKFILLHAQGDYAAQHLKIPHIGQEAEFLRYLKYIRYMESSDDEKKILAVEHALDNPIPAFRYPGFEPEPPEGWWRPPVWGKYAKFNLVYSVCYSGSNGYGAKKEKRKRREKLKQDIKESLEA
jgi:hypothetical protein